MYTSCPRLYQCPRRGRGGVHPHNGCTMLLSSGTFAKRSKANPSSSGNGGRSAIVEDVVGKEKARRPWAIYNKSTMGKHDGKGRARLRTSQGTLAPAMLLQRSLSVNNPSHRVALIPLLQCWPCSPSENTVTICNKSYMS